jgi:hypothetical protein
MAAVSNNEGIMNKQTKGGWIIAKFHNSGGIKLNAADTTTGGGVPVWGANSAGETVVSMNIISAEVNCGGANNVYFEIKRGASMALVLSGTDYFDLSDSRLIDNTTAMSTSNVTITKVNTGPATLVLKLHKTVAITGGSRY